MQKIVDQITDHLVSLVTADKPAYNPKELLKSGIPSFIVERVRMSLEDKVREELGGKKSEWYEIDNRLVQDAWSDFLRTAISTSHIPREELYTVLNSVVKDIIYVFIEPRKNMAEYVFRDDEELSYDEMELRCQRLTIYKHFGTAIPLYMKKRKLQTLTKERCKELIHKLDAKLVASYTAQDWAQKLEQLFVLFEGQVDPKLLATFFEDKGLNNLAQKFAKRRKLITKTDFIYIISNENLTDFLDEEKEEEIQEKDQSVAPKVPEKAAKKDDPEQSLIESFFGDYEYIPGEEEPILAGQFVDGLSDDEMTELLSDIASDGVIEVDDYDHVASLNELFSISKKEEEQDDSKSETSEEIAASIKTHKDEGGEEIKAFRDNLISILDQAKNSYENMDKEEEEEVAEEATPEPPAPLIDEEEPAESDEEKEVTEGEEPMWAKFLSPDQMEVIMGSKRKKEEVESESEFEEEPEPEILDSNDGNDDEGIEVEDFAYSDDPLIDESQEVTVPLSDLLEDREQEFIEVIFSGSDDSYKKAIKKIEQFVSWKETSAFIQKDVFAKNDVDMLSGATVDFTDRLHHYFNELRNT